MNRIHKKAGSLTVEESAPSPLLLYGGHGVVRRTLPGGLDAPCRKPVENTFRDTDSREKMHAVRVEEKKKKRSEKNRSEKNRRKKVEKRD